MRLLKRFLLSLAPCILVCQATQISHATCSTYENPIGPYAVSDCFGDTDCDNHDESLMCQEWDCSNCKNEPTGYTQFCIEYYDCGTMQTCSHVVCT